MSEAAPAPVRDDVMPLVGVYAALATAAAAVAFVTLYVARHALGAPVLDRAATACLAVCALLRLLALWIERRTDSTTPGPAKATPDSWLLFAVVGAIAFVLGAVVGALAGFIGALALGRPIGVGMLQGSGVGAALGVVGVLLGCAARVVARRFGRPAPRPWRRVTMIGAPTSAMQWTLAAVCAGSAALTLAVVDLSLGTSSFRIAGRACLAASLFCAFRTARGVRRAGGVRRFVRDTA